jgi:hypothetical protein
MIKTFVATGFTCLAVGSIIGYAISELTRSPQNLQAQTAPAAVATASPKPLTRNELERRYIACIGRDVKLTRFSDADLNNDLYECETQRKANSNR